MAARSADRGGFYVWHAAPPPCFAQFASDIPPACRFIGLPSPFRGGLVDTWGWAFYLPARQGTARSSNGKTTDSDSVNRGSNPRRASNNSLLDQADKTKLGRLWLLLCVPTISADSRWFSACPSPSVQHRCNTPRSLSGGHPQKTAFFELEINYGFVPQARPRGRA